MILIHSQVQPPKWWYVRDQCGWLIAPLQVVSPAEKPPWARPADTNQREQEAGTPQSINSLVRLLVEWRPPANRTREHVRGCTVGPIWHLTVQELGLGSVCSSEPPGWSPWCFLFSRQEILHMGAVYGGLSWAECRGLKRTHWRASCWFFGSGDGLSEEEKH